MGNGRARGVLSFVFDRQPETKPMPAKKSVPPAVKLQPPAGGAARHVGKILLSLDDIRDMGIKVSRAQVYKLMAQGAFPRNVKISPFNSAWIYDEVVAWLEARMAERDGEAT
jgi:prophage regulatory protein